MAGEGQGRIWNNKLRWVRSDALFVSHTAISTKIDPGQAATSAAGALWRCGCHWLKPGTCSWNRGDAAEHRSLPNSTNLHCFTAPWAFERLECFTLVLSTVPVDIVWHDWTWHSHWTLVVLDPLWPLIWGFKSRKWRAVQSQQCSTLWQERASWCPVLWTTIWQDLITDLFVFSVCSASLMNQWACSSSTWVCGCSHGGKRCTLSVSAEASPRDLCGPCSGHCIATRSCSFGWSCRGTGQNHTKPTKKLTCQWTEWVTYGWSLINLIIGSYPHTVCLAILKSWKTSLFCSCFTLLIVLAKAVLQEVTCLWCCCGDVLCPSASCVCSTTPGLDSGSSTTRLGMSQLAQRFACRSGGSRTNSAELLGRFKIALNRLSNL